MDKDDILASHPLIEQVFTNLRPVLDAFGDQLKDVAEQSGKIRIKDEQALPEYQYYDVMVFRKAFSLVDCIYQVEDTKWFIGRFPSPRRYEKEGITQHRWIEYHYSHYVVTLVSLGNLSLILVNVVFRLGIPEKLCTGELIKQNEWVSASSVNKSLSSLEKITKRHSPLRNLYVHRGKTPELHQVFESNLLDYLKLYSFLNQAGHPVVDRKLLDLVYKGEISKILERLDAEITQTKQAVRELLDSLFPIYERHALLLRQQESAYKPR